MTKKNDNGQIGQMCSFGPEADIHIWKQVKFILRLSQYVISGHE